MKPFVMVLVLAVVMFVMTEEGVAASDVQVENLRCEYRYDPLGIDDCKPRLSWIIKSEGRCRKQTAYQIQVADSEDKLADGKANLWDTEKVVSQKTAHIVYGGKPLKSRMRCYWRVRVWDEDVKASAWSEPAMWTMGLLNDSDWQAKWIGINKPIKEPQANILKDALWIWYREGDPIKGIADCVRYFRRSLHIPHRSKIESAKLAMTADNQFNVFINGNKVSGSSFHIPFEVEVRDFLREGGNVIATEVENIGDRPKTPAGLIGALEVKFEDGERLYVRTDSTWICCKDEEKGWMRKDFDDSDWSKALALARCGIKPWGDVSKREMILPPPTYLRRSFHAEKAVKRATVYASSQGIYELRINGKKAGNDYFTPGWTDYYKRIYYNTYDVTSMVTKGVNAIGAVVADGWYAGYVGWGLERWHYGRQSRLLAQLEIEYEDGGTEVVATDSDWRGSTEGPLFEADFLMGEGYDARRQMPGWDQGGYDDSEWNEVAVSSDIKAKVEAYPGVPVRKFAKIRPVEITEPVEGVYIYNLGRNFAGWVRLKVNGKAGDKVFLRFGERLNPDGTLYTLNLRGARARDTYICKGEGEEIWEPRFTFHGFQYVELTGYPGKPDLDTITGLAISSDTPVVGEFECSSEMANQLYSNIYWTQRANFIEVPTDCPQRDERQGWMGDAQAFIRAGTYNTDVGAFFTKWMVDVVDAQTKKGAFPDYAPGLGHEQSASPAWADAGIICPWVIYHVYGDKRILSEHYEAMDAWIRYCKRNSDDLVRPAKGYGDWLNISAETPKDVIATAYFARSTQLMVRIANVLGKKQDAAKYQQLWQGIKSAFNKVFVKGNGIIKGNTQTGYVLAIAFDLVEGRKRDMAVKHLIERIKERDGHLSTGFLGTKDLMVVLNDIGEVELAYKLFMNETFPSWFFCIRHGATSIWERWDGWTPSRGFQNAGMNSFAHYAFGAVGEWMFKTICGIDTADAGYNNILIKPRPGGRLDYARASYESVNGEISTNWRIDEQNFQLDVTIPCNTRALVHIPTSSAGSVTEGGEPAAKSEGVEFVEAMDNIAIYRIGSGRYSFKAKR